jgi:hypothetical protein
VFQPTDFSARQWSRVARKAGFETVLLTAKHHDGFALWLSAYTEHDVASSPWRDGEGDVVGALAEAARAEGLDPGLHLSPWDRHEPTYGTDDYNAFYMAQLRELLANYGSLREVWFDGAKGEDARASPLINAFGLHFDAHTPATAQSGTSDTAEVSRTVIPLDLPASWGRSGGLIAADLNGDDARDLVISQQGDPDRLVAYETSSDKLWGFTPDLWLGDKTEVADVRGD